MLLLKNAIPIFRNFQNGHDLNIEISIINYFGTGNLVFGILISHFEPDKVGREIFESTIMITLDGSITQIRVL